MFEAGHLSTAAGAMSGSDIDNSDRRTMVSKTPQPRIQLAEFSSSKFLRGRPALIEAVWLLAQWMFISSWIPGAAHRRWLLRAFGAKIGRGVNIKSGVRVKFPWRLEVGDYTWIGEDVWIDNLAQVIVGSNCCISQRAYLCTGSHDWSHPKFELITHPIEIKEGAWIAACATVGPGVTVGEGAVLGLGSVASHDLEPWTVYAGVPAKSIRRRLHSDADEHLNN